MTTRNPDREGDFLGRWSRLKRTRVDEDEAPAPAAPAVSDDASAGEQAQPPKSDDELLAELGLPHPDTLAAGDDFSAFMAKAVPEHLRRMALRKLWTSNPVLACLDDLVDYADDYTDAALAVEQLSTGYRVGRGFLPESVDEEGTREASDEPGIATVSSDTEAVRVASSEGEAQSDSGRGDAGEADAVQPDEDVGSDASPAEQEGSGNGPSGNAISSDERVVSTQTRRMHFRLADS